MFDIQDLDQNQDNHYNFESQTTVFSQPTESLIRNPKTFPTIPSHYDSFYFFASAICSKMIELKAGEE
jgi:hypothetical protein